MVGGRILRKGDSWGIDMTLEGPWRQRLTGMAKVFSATLCLPHHHLERVLADNPDDAWACKKVSVRIALQRHIKFLAQQVTKAGRLKSSLLQAMNEFKPVQGHHHHQTHRDDFAFLVKIIQDNQIENESRNTRLEKRQ